MHIYRGTLELLDYVFYATVERGKVYETGAFLHNYALAYAFGLASAPYSHLLQEPHYLEELTPLNEAGVYLTPASPVRMAHRLVQWNTIQEGYGFAGKARSIGYPDWGFARVLRPESVFQFYVLVSNPRKVPNAPAFRDALEGRVVRLRLGKFPGKARVRLQEAVEVKGPKTGSFESTGILLNWRDISADPVVCDVLAASLPTRLIRNARFEDGSYYQARFGKEEIVLPAGMRFLARPPAGKR